MHFFKCLLKVQKVINKTVKKLTFNFSQEAFCVRFQCQLFGFSTTLKNTITFFFFFIVKNEKRMDVKVHGPMPYTGTEFFFFFAYILVLLKTFMLIVLVVCHWL